MRPSSNLLPLIFFYRLPVFALCTVIFWQSSYPGIISAPLFPHDDKVIHFGVYALLSLLVARDLDAENPSWSRAKIRMITLIFVFAYGFSDELHQAFVPSRDASVWDLMADCGGSIFGCFFYQGVLSRKKQASG